MIIQYSVVWKHRGVKFRLWEPKDHSIKQDPGVG